MIHCGSRGYGWQTANPIFTRARRCAVFRRTAREDSWLRIDEPLGREYWAHHNSAANYAVANRHIIVRGVQEALSHVFAKEGEVYYEISHNLVQQETLVLPDGTTEARLRPPQGRDPRVPAGHPDLVATAWEKTGHPCLMSRLDVRRCGYPSSHNRAHRAPGSP